MGRNEDLDRELRVEKDNFAQSIRSLRRQLLVAQADIEKLRKENSDKVASQSDLEKVILIYIDIDTGLSNWFSEAKLFDPINNLTLCFLSSSEAIGGARCGYVRHPRAEKSQGQYGWLSSYFGRAVSSIEIGKWWVAASIGWECDSDQHPTKHDNERQKYSFY